MPFDTDTFTLKAFVAVAETLHFTRAAERIGRSQSALSLQIQRLEEGLGRTLFTRSQRRVALTEAGEVFLSYARRMLDLQRDALSRLSEAEAEGEIRLGTPEDFATHYLPEVLAGFRRLHPRALLNVGCDLTLNLMAAFDRGEYDIVLVKRDPQAVTGGLRVWREPLVWVMSDALPEAPVLSLALSPPPCIYRARALAALDRQGRGWRIGYTSPSLAGTVAAVRAGLGVSVLPAHMVPRGLKPAPETAGLPDLPDAEIAMLTRPDLSEAGRILARHIVSSLESPLSDTSVKIP